MAKKKKLIPFLSQSKSLDTKLPFSSQWHFPSCGYLNTLSFRATTSTNYSNNNLTFTTFNSAYLDSNETLTISPSSSSSSRSFSTMSDRHDTVESVIRGLKSERFFFEPMSSCSLVCKNSNPTPVENLCEEGAVVYKESETLCMESSNPCEDFKRSMEEMVEAHGLKDWEDLEELLGCYLKINDKMNHGYIMGAFIDLLVNLDFISSTTKTTTSTTTTTTTTNSSSNNLNSLSSPSSPLSLPSSSLTTPCLSSLLEDNNDCDDNEDDNDEVVDDRSQH